MRKWLAPALIVLASFVASGGILWWATHPRATPPLEISPETGLPIPPEGIDPAFVKQVEDLQRNISQLQQEAQRKGVGESDQVQNTSGGDIETGRMPIPFTAGDVREMAFTIVGIDLRLQKVGKSTPPEQETNKKRLQHVARCLDKVGILPQQASVENVLSPEEIEILLQDSIAALDKRKQLDPWEVTPEETRAIVQLIREEMDSLPPK